jgi:superfamily II RNA helicase
MLQGLSFNALAHQLACFYVMHCPAPTSPSISELLKSPKCTKRDDSVALNSAEFQLQYMGPMMHRCFGSEPDARMQGAFDPDAWQRKVLDAIDAEHSALVVAATSLGKTAICLYTLQRMLDLRAKSPQRQKLVVYVAPTKALANQVAADFYNRCKSRSMKVGIFTRDYRFNEMDCDVLVTVP